MNCALKRWILSGLCLSFSLTAVAQKPLIDSLKNKLVKFLPDTSRALTYHAIARDFYRRNQFDSAQVYLTQMLPVCQRTRFWYGLGSYYQLSGNIARNRGMFETALVQLQQAATYFQKSNRPHTVATVYNNMGYLYKHMGNNGDIAALTNQGIDYIQRAVVLNQAAGKTTGLIDNYINLGICYEDLKEFTTALRYYQMAEQLARKQNPANESLGVIYNDIGNLFQKQQQNDSAIPFLERAIAINQKLGRKSSLVHNHRNLSTAYYELKKTPQALHHAKQALAFLAEVNDASLARSVYRVLRIAYAANGQHAEAYQFLLREKTIEDSLMNIQKTRIIANLQGKYEQQKAAELATIRANLELEKTKEVASVEAKTAREVATIEAEKKHRIAQIEAQAEVAKTRAVTEVQTRYETAKKTQQISELSEQNTLKARQMAYLVGGLGLVLLLLGISFVQYWAIRRANAQLSEQNRVIAETSDRLTEQSSQLRTLMRELHHRVKNNLAIVSSLLNLQTYRLTDTGAIEAVQESQRRVEAMSLIHQRLYRTDAVTTINMADYITDLAESLMAAYGYGPDTFDLSVSVNQPELDVDSAIPLGLILNELLTNSFKYAYGNNRHRIGRRNQPSLRIDLHQQNGLTLEVQDNGPGLDLNQWRNLDIDTDSFGRQLIWSLSEQVGGKITVDNRDGAYFQLTIPQAA
ncbi:tetratricopeptide repeat-containing sensor histidine kinase [Spirosoma validum]|uniref:histidine kinase n=1 Tax=Spirosoma validum TaxID=2771355 RepID=A0A927B638_9BACT|nr:histidine kinase dimerization/phosphoacceptor domain -containing protein [Spirosoma validum]MBD2755877.1 tetratricopeptide repeat protein [Spirosoma validum]